jgi:hypothetical protein
MTEARELARTQFFEISNQTTQFAVTLAVAAGYQTSGGTPPGYQQSTGVIVIATDLVPGGVQRGYVPPSTNVMSTLVRCGLHWRRIVEPYDEGTLMFPDTQTEYPHYYEYLRYDVVEEKDRSARGRMSIALRQSIRTAAKAV